VRVYRFSLGLGVVAILSGLWLFWWWSFPLWAWTKLGLVTLLAAHYGWTGRLILRARKRGIFEESDLWLRVFNEISVLGAIGVLILVVFKPF
jgi:putative membrane protein